MRPEMSKDSGMTFGGVAATTKPEEQGGGLLHGVKRPEMIDLQGKKRKSDVLEPDPLMLGPPAKKPMI